MTAGRRPFIRKILACSFAAAAFFAVPVTASAQSLSPAEARQIAEDAYVYGYSLITTEVPAYREPTSRRPSRTD